MQARWIIVRAEDTALIGGEVAWSSIDPHEDFGFTFLIKCEAIIGFKQRIYVI